MNKATRKGRFLFSIALSPALPRHRLLDAFHPCGARSGHAIQQSVRADFECIAHSCERNDRHGKSAVLNVADGLPVNAGELGETFLREVGLESGRFHVLPDEP